MVAIVYTRPARKGFRKCPQRIQDAVVRRMRAIAEAPYAAHANVAALRGQAAAFRLRVGDWRVVYTVERDAGRIVVHAVAPRGSVYR